MDEFASGDDTAYYIYDADKKRVQAKRNGTVEKYALSGNDVVADYDGEDTVTATYNTPSLDYNIAKKVGENVYFYLKDALGSIRNVVDSDETIQNTYDYKAFGAVQGTPTENVTNRYRFTSREWEVFLNQYFYRARMYAQNLGKFISRDPVSYKFPIHWYVYAGSNPLRFTDHLGLFSGVDFTKFINRQILLQGKNSFLQRNVNVNAPCCDCCYEHLMSVFTWGQLEDSLNDAVSYIKSVFVTILKDAVEAYLKSFGIGWLDTLVKAAKYADKLATLVKDVLNGEGEQALISFADFASEVLGVDFPGQGIVVDTFKYLLGATRVARNNTFDTGGEPGCGGMGKIFVNEHWNALFKDHTRVDVNYLIVWPSCNCRITATNATFIGGYIQEGASQGVPRDQALAAGLLWLECDHCEGLSQ